MTYRKYICGYEYYGSSKEDWILNEWDFDNKPLLMELAGDQNFPELINYAKLIIKSEYTWFFTIAVINYYAPRATFYIGNL